MGIPESTAAPAEITLGGKTFRMRPLSFAEIGEFERWAQDEYLQRVERSVKYLDEAAKAEERRKAAAIMRKMSMVVQSDDAEALREMDETCRSIEGLTRLIWLGLRREHPELTLPEVGNLLADQKAIDAAKGHWKRINRAGDDDEGKARGRTRKDAA